MKKKKNLFVNALSYRDMLIVLALIFPASRLIGFFSLPKVFFLGAILVLLFIFERLRYLLIYAVGRSLANRSRLKLLQFPEGVLSFMIVIPLVLTINVYTAFYRKHSSNIICVI